MGRGVPERTEASSACSAATSTRWTRSAPEKPSVRRASRAASAPPTRPPRSAGARGGARGEPRAVGALDRTALERVLEDRRAGGLVGRQDEERAVQATGPAQRGVDVPRVVGRGEDEDALVVGLCAVELGQQLVDDVAPRRVAQVAALLAESVEL